jgi:hypothetical protein
MAKPFQDQVAMGSASWDCLCGRRFILRSAALEHTKHRRKDRKRHVMVRIPKPDARRAVTRDEAIEIRKGAVFADVQLDPHAESVARDADLEGRHEEAIEIRRAYRPAPSAPIVFESIDGELKGRGSWLARNDQQIHRRSRKRPLFGEYVRRLYE